MWFIIGNRIPEKYLKINPDGFQIWKFGKGLNSFGFGNDFQKVRRNNSGIISGIFLIWNSKIFERDFKEIKASNSLSVAGK